MTKQPQERSKNKHPNLNEKHPKQTLLMKMIDENKLSRKTTAISLTVLTLIIAIQLAPSGLPNQIVEAAEQSPSTPKPWRLRFQTQVNRAQSQPVSSAAAAPASKPLATHGTGSAIELPVSSIVVGSPPIVNQPISQPISQPQPNQKPQQPATTNHHNEASHAINSSNRTTRTADVFQNGDGFNMFVTNTCERETMRINVKTSRPFYGVIHTRDHRKKPECSIEGTGASEYNLDISQTMVASDPNYCGALRGARETPQDSEIVSLVVAVRVHKSIELSDDRFFLLNCTNRCRKSDCSAPANGRLTSDPDSSANLRGGRLIESEGEREFANNNDNRNQTSDQECNIYRFPWAVSLLWALAIMCIALIISHCFLCSSLVCRCVRREVEEQEPSIYGDGSIVDYDNKNATQIKKIEHAKANKHPYRIEYDNRDIYKTSNNYDPYCLDDEHDDDQDELDNRRRHRRHDHESEPKRRHHKHSHR